MDQTQQNTIIAEFVDITQASPDEAHEFLDATHWNLQEAIATFFASREGEEDQMEAEAEAEAETGTGTGTGRGRESPTGVPAGIVPAGTMPAGTADTARGAGGGGLGGPFQGSRADGHTSANTGGPRSWFGSSGARNPARTSPSSGSSGNRRFATLSDFAKESRSSTSPTQNSGSDEDDDGSGGAYDAPDNLFTGGEKSGLAVQNPDSSQNAGHRLIADIFRRAQRNQQELADLGAGTGAGGEGSGPAAGGGGGSGGRRQTGAATDPFRGVGFTLGGDNVPSQQVGTESRAGGRGPRLGHGHGHGHEEEDEDEDASRVTRRLTFWRDGFSIEDGPLYRYDDPNNVAYLQAIHSGRAPLALLNLQSGQSVDLRIHRRTDEDYQAPKKPIGGYHGSGNRLGSPVPGEPLGGAGAGAPAVAPTGSASTQPASNAPIGEGDTTVQIRLGTGRAARVRFQSAGPVQQLYDYVDGETQDARPYVLQTTFPNRELTDRDVSLLEAKVCGSVVVQKWK